MASNGNASSTRTHIVEAAAAIIAENGFSALTAASLIQRAGISKGGLYHHFKHMEAVSVAVLELIAERFVELLDTRVDSSIEAMLERMRNNHREIALAHTETAKVLCCFFEQAIHKDVYQPALSSMNRQVEKVRRTQFKAIRSVGQVDNVEQCLALLETYMRGLLVSEYLDCRNEAFQQQQWALLTDMFSTYLAAANKEDAETSDQRNVEWVVLGA